MRTGVVCHRGKPWEYFVDGRKVTKAQFDKRLPGKEMGPPAGSAWNRPWYSEALGVHPKQIPEAMAFAEKAGVNVQFEPSGRVTGRGRGARKAWAKLNGFVDVQGGYGDA